MKKTRARPTGRPSSPKIADWAPKAEKALAAVLKKAQTQAELKRRLASGAGGGLSGGKRSSVRWSAEVRLVGAAAMRRLNGQYRAKHYATDVLSFASPAVFRAHGMLGELVICLPTLVLQAAERGHSPLAELQVLLIHGVLHLLGFDHERGPRHAREMARWEARLLGRAARGRGLIARAE